MKCDNCQHKVVCKKRHLMKDFVHVDNICETWQEEFEKDSKWHDLRKNRNDLPEIGKVVIIGVEIFENELIYYVEKATKVSVNVLRASESHVCWKYLDEFKG